MMQNQFPRTQLLLGKPAIDTLNSSRVAVFGVGGVDGCAVEILTRSDVRAIDVIDDNRVCLINVNRQLLATIRAAGEHKVDVTKERIHSINPRCIVRKYQTFCLPDNADQFDFSHCDYVVDCIDTVAVRPDLIYRCHEINIPLLSCMGAAYKLDATWFRVTDIFETTNDPLAEVIRKKLRRTKIKHLRVVYSPEGPLGSIEQPKISYRFHCIYPDKNMRKCTNRHTIPSFNTWVPAATGLAAGGEAVKDLVNLANTMRIRPEDEAISEPARITHKCTAKMLEEHERLKTGKATANKQCFMKSA